jgi:HPr kinase/phosphorylase
MTATQSNASPPRLASAPHRLHACAVAIDGLGVLLLGPSGSGKSDLALRLIDAYQAQLIADDLVEWTLAPPCDAQPDAPLAVMATSPRAGHAALQGVLEVRGLGLVAMPRLGTAPLHLAVNLGSGLAERLPEPEFFALGPCQLPLLRLCAFHASAPARIRLALRCIAAGLPFIPPHCDPIDAVPSKPSP